MRLDTASLAKFVGGQMQLNCSLGLFRGEIKTIAVTDGDLHVSFAWMAQAAGPEDEPIWSKDFRLAYSAVLENYAATVFSGPKLPAFIDLPDVEQTITLFPPDGHRLDPETVRGLCRLRLVS